MKDKEKYAGIILTAAAHCLLLIILTTAGIRKTDYEPPVSGMLIEFPDPMQEEPPEPVPIRTAVGVEPKAEKASPEKEVALVQKSEAPLAAEADNTGPETTVGNDGDIDVQEPPRPKPIDRRALFSANRNDDKDSAAVQVAEKVTDRLKAGHTLGNTDEGNPDGLPTARLEGRTVMGNLPVPSYTVAKSGTVVVRITVDQYGTVINAIPGVKGTTVQDATLWEAARKAALEAKFNISQSAPAVQEGTISYVFTLK